MKPAAQLAKFIRSNILFFCLSTAVILGLNLTPLILDVNHSPPGRTFALIHNNAQDFFFYQSLMNQGANGAFLTRDSFTSEPHSSSIVFSYFLWLGKLSKWLSLPYAYMYHFIRITLSIFFFTAVFALIRVLKVPYPRITYLFFLFASPFLHTINDYGNFRVVPYMYWWTGIDSIRRAAYLPHHMFGGLFLIISLLLIISHVRKPAPRKIIYLLAAAALLTFVHTPSLFILLLILPPSIALNILTNSPRSNKDRFEKVKLQILKHAGIIGYWCISLVLLFFMVSETSKGFPWSQYIDWEKRLQFPLYPELFWAFGVLLPLATIGLIRSIVDKSFERNLIAVWFSIPILLIPIAPKLGISNIRLTQGVPFLGLSLLAVIGASEIITILESRKELFPQLIAANMKNGVLLIISLFFLAFTFPTIKWSIQDQSKEYWPIFGNVYFDNRLTSAFTFIDRNFPIGTVTLSTFYTGNYMPAFTHTVSFIGHSGYTYNIDAKQPLVRKFFENSMSANEAQAFLTANKIALVFQGPEEKPIFPGKLYPELLKTVYDREEVTIYVPIF